MKSLGTKERMYPSLDDSKEKTHYPSVTFPFSLLEKEKINVGKDVMFKVKGKITRISQDEYSEGFTVDLREGESVSDTPKK